MNQQLFVSGIASNTTVSQLAELFERHGVVLSVKFPTDITTGKLRGFAFVKMDSPQQAEQALRQIDGTSLNGRFLRVAEAVAPAESRPASQR